MPADRPFGHGRSRHPVPVRRSGAEQPEWAAMIIRFRDYRHADESDKMHRAGDGATDRGWATNLGRCAASLAVPPVLVPSAAVPDQEVLP